MTLSDHVTFLRGWVCDPLRITAIAPSSLALAHLITSEISADNVPVIELGPGTGVFTRRLKFRRYGFRPRWLEFLIEESLRLPDPATWPNEVRIQRICPFPLLPM